jgi:hypothetical protein
MKSKALIKIRLYLNEIKVYLMQRMLTFAQNYSMIRY